MDNLSFQCRDIFQLSIFFMGTEYWNTGKEYSRGMVSFPFPATDIPLAIFSITAYPCGLNHDINPP